MYRGPVKRALAVFAALFSCACGKETRFVAVEPESPAEIRVVAAVGPNAQRSIKALTREEPFPLPLSDIFDEGGALDVYVFRYQLSALTAAFPGLAGADAAAVAAALNPAFGASGPGKFDAPPTFDGKMLSARVTDDGPGDVEYAEQALDVSRAGGGFVFQLAAPTACPPGQGEVRVFNRENAGQVCIVQRNDACEWVGEQDCDDFDRLFRREGEGADLEVREVPPNGIKLDPLDVTCTEDPSRLNGESRTFLCPIRGGGTTQVSIQNVARGRGGVAWVPEARDVPNLQGARPVFARGAKGAVYAYARANLVELRRIAASNANTVTDEPLQVLLGPGNPDNISIPSAGEVQSISADTTGDHLAVSGSLVGAVLDRDNARVPDDNSFYTTPVRIPESALPVADRRGTVIIGPGQGLYALVNTGIATLSRSGNTVVQNAITPAGTVSFELTDEAKIAAVRNRNNQDRIVAWTKNGRLSVFKSDALPVVTNCELTEVLAVIEGPRAFIRRTPALGFHLELIDLAAVEGGAGCDQSSVRYLIPPNDQDAAGQQLSIDSLTYLNDGMRESIVYRYGDSGGVLEIGSGLSQARSFGEPFGSSILFPAQGNNRFWVLLAPESSLSMRGFLIPAFESP